MTNNRSPYVAVNARRRARHPSRRSLVMTLAVGVTVGLVALLLAILTPTPPPPPPEPVVVAALFGADAPLEISTPAFETALRISTEEEHHLLVGPLTNSTAAANVRLTADGGYDLERARNLEEKETKARNRFHELIANPTSDGTALDGLHALDQHLASLPHRRTDVLLVGSVLHVAPDVDLIDPIQRGDPEASLAKVIADGLLPHCKGWRVHIVAGSATAGEVRDSQLDLQVREFWRRLIAKCGGVLTLWDTSQLPSFPASTEVPIATFGGECQLRFTLDSDVLFADGRADILPGALPTLKELLVKLTITHPDARASIDGYTAFPGSPGIDLLQLSRNRAEAVNRWLVDHGVGSGRIATNGHGPENPVASNDTDAGRQLNRRVEIQVQLAHGDCENGGKA
jgi:outer membrane protein OmpA-like peptidoglycan-associated protein